MNTPRALRRRSFSLIVQVTALLVFNPRMTAEATTSNPPIAKDHVLFVGTDLTVKQDDKFYRVVGASKKNLKVERDHAVTDVRLSGAPSVKIIKGVKLSNRSATIGKVQIESVDREAARAQLAAMHAAMALSDDAGDSADRAHGAMIDSIGINSDLRADDGSLVKGVEVALANVAAQRLRARENYADALPNLSRLSASTSTLLNQNLMQPNAGDDELTLDASSLPGLTLTGGAKLGDSGSSAGSSIDISKGNVATGTTEVELTFEVSSPEPLENAYILVVANYASLTKPNEVARQISAQEFARIDSHPTKVKMTHSASMNRMPFKKFDIALFANGQEIATNLSENRMGLTADQAYQFFLIDYLRSHKGANVPPTPMLMVPRSEFRKKVADAQSDQAIYAHVDKTGNVLEMSVDPAGKERVSSSMESALQNVRFMPALNKGTPVEGRIKVTLAQLAN